MDFKGLSFKFVFNRKNQKNLKNEFHIQLRITLNREAKYFSLTDLPKISAKYWSGKENRWVKESHPSGSIINSYLISKLSKLNDFLVRAKISGKPVNFKLIKSEFFNKGEIKTFNQFFQKHLDTYRFKKPGTKKAYQTSLTTLNEFNPEILFQTLNMDFIREFIEWERNVKKNRDVTIDKHYRHISTLAKLALKSGLLQFNPLEGSKSDLKPEKAFRISLSQEEVSQLSSLKFSVSESHMERDRDIFVFQCLTGLYYKDVLELVEENLVKSKGKTLIRGSRTKNGEDYIVPLSVKANEILIKFEKFRNSSKLFSGLSQEPVYNRSLKKIAEKAKISKRISNKVGRHTFTENAIASGIPRSFVTKMLGHTKESTTQHYYDINATHFINGVMDHNFFA